MVELKQIDEFMYEIPKDGRMNVPGRVFASEKLLTTITKDNSLEQVKNVASLPGILDASIVMPDAHQGYGFSIGGVAAFDASSGIVSPGGVGYDINCGVRLLATDISKEDFLKVRDEIAKRIDSVVPSGVGNEQKSKLEDNELDEFLIDGAAAAVRKGMGRKEDLEYTEEGGRVDGADLSKISGRVRARGRGQLGTLGAGNHFLEFQFVDEIFDETLCAKWGLVPGKICVMIHCGSRGFGHQVATESIRAMEAAGLPEDLVDRELVYAHLGTELADNYLGAMQCAVNFAFANRQIIMHRTREILEEFFPGNVNRLVYDVAHNIAKFEEHIVGGKAKQKVCIHRKGATRAFEGQPVIIPGSMGTASYVLVGTKKAEELTFGSTAHGAGRVMSRSRAVREINSDDVVKQMEADGIKVYARSKKGISAEAAGVYKDIEEVARVSDGAGIATRVCRLKPLAVVKG
ncbi:MAG: tRNA-splicing ligase RtcB [Patescibacteria group bacterium]|jgi:tRNA-splicing ligase RtcB